MSMQLIRPNAVSEYVGSTSFPTVGYFYNQFGNLIVSSGTEPRLNYNPDDLTEAPMLLLENAATNLLLQSSVFTNVYWTTTNASVQATHVTSPTGASADRINFNATNGQITSSAITTTVGEEYTFSIYLKGTQGQIAYIFVVYSGTGPVGVLQVELTSSWKKYSTTTTSTGNSSTNTCEVRIATYDGTTAGGADRAVYVDAWGGQFELGSVATSTIATTTAAVTRNADSIQSNMYSNITEPGFGESGYTWSATTIYIEGDRVIDLTTTTDHNIYENTTGTAGTCTITIASPAVVTLTVVNAAVTPGVISFTTTGALPTGLSPNTTYYLNAYNPTTKTANLSLTNGGANINTSGTQSGVHSYRTNGVSSYGVRPIQIMAYWVVVQTDNKWAMFDSVISNRSSNGNIISVIIPSFDWQTGNAALLDSVAGLNIDCASMRVTAYTVPQYDDTFVKVYDQVTSGVDPIGINNIFSYLTEPIVKRENLVFQGIPPYGHLIVSVIFYNKDDTVYCGELILGQSKVFGALQANAKVGIQDYSIKEQDDFGNYVIVPRAYSNKGNYTIWIENTQVGYVKTLLTNYRSTPILYIGDPEAQYTFVYGFYKDFSITLPYPTVSVCDLELEGTI